VAAAKPSKKLSNKSKAVLAKKAYFCKLNEQKFL